LDIYAVRKTGTWPAGSSSISFTTTIWPNQTYYENATTNDQYEMFLVTSGSGTPSDRTYFQVTPFKFVKSCD